MIPKRVTFQLMGRTFEVLRRPASEEQGNKGYCESDQQRIRIYVDPSEREMYGHTVCHELVHALLEAAGKDDLSNDDGFVEVLGGLLWQALDSGLLRALPPCSGDSRRGR